MYSQRNTFWLGMLIAFGLIVSASIASFTAYRIAGSRQSVVVKGLAEKRVSADHAQWTIGVSGSGKTLPEAFASLRANRPQVQTFLREHGFADEMQQLGRETFYIVYRTDKDGRQTREIENYVANQSLLVSTEDVKLVDKVAGEIVALLEKGVPISVGEPEFLVSTLESVKMSLIAEATKNAFDRANEFARTGNAKVGAMKSASQGAFYILPAQGDASSMGDYGGAYDKGTIDKIARVVVTIEYALAQ